MTLVVLMGVPLAFIFLSVVSRRIQTQIDTQKEHLSRATRIVNRAFTAIETVKAFNGQQYERYVFALAAGRPHVHIENKRIAMPWLWAL